MTGQPTDIVVGGASGIGAAAAEAMRSDRRLLIVDKSGDAAAAVADRLGAEAVECDLTDSDAVHSLAERIPVLGSMIVTAGVNFGSDRFMLDVNLVGPARLMAAVRPKATSGSSAVLFSSMVELFPQSPEVEDALAEPLAPDLIERLICAGAQVTDDPLGQSGYLLAKTGIIRLTRLAAIDWWSFGGRVNSITPGVIDTPMLDRVKDPAGRASMLEMAERVGRLGRAEEVGRVAAFLASDDASFVNGVNVTVAGGLVTMIQEERRRAS